MKTFQVYKLQTTPDAKCYIGSTTKPLSQRLSEHICMYSRWIQGKRQPYVSSFDVIGIDKDSVFVKAFNGERIFIDYDAVSIELLEICRTKEEMRQAEKRFVKESQCVNRNMPCRTSQEYYNDKIDYFKQYYQERKQAKQAYGREYYKRKKLQKKIF